MSGCVVIAAGGTGGHMFPALAVAEALERRGRTIALLTDARGARYVQAPRACRVISAASPSGSLREIARGIFLLLRGTAGSIRSLAELRPAAVALFGGYASVPAALAAALRRTPLLVHEQNAVFGRANRLAGRFADTLALSFEATRALPGGTRSRRTVTGNPVRPGFAAAETPEAERFGILVLGGSQGAKVLSDVVPAAVALLPQAVRERLEIAQQCRPEDLQRVRDAYAAVPFAPELASFFDDVPRRMAQAGLVIARSGASTIAEILATGRPSVLVPYPHAADDHQTANARALADDGAAVLLPQPEAAPQRLASELAALLAAPDRLAAMRRAARGLARPGAAETLADAVVAMEGAGR